MTLLLFAEIAEIAGTHRMEIAARPSMTVGELKAELAAAVGKAGLADKLAVCMAAVNQRYCTDEAVVREQDEVAFIPPVSGG